MNYIKNTIASQLPKHIVENYPLFVDFLEAYYEWVETSGAYSHINKHIDRLFLSESLDSYIDQLKNEYLHFFPKDFDYSEKDFIKWAGEFNLSRGSIKSFKFLFNLLYQEQIEIVKPRDSIFSSSSGTWNKPQRKLILSDSGTSKDYFIYQRITQTRKIYDDIYEYASATVEKAQKMTLGKFKVLVLYLKDIDGEFDPAFPIYGEDGKFEWMMPTNPDFVIDNPGSGYSENDLVKLEYTDGFFDVQGFSKTDNQFDTNITTYYSKQDIKLFVDDYNIDDFEFDGRKVYSPTIVKDISVIVRFPSFDGTSSVGSIGPNGNVKRVVNIEPAIGKGEYETTIYSQYGTGLELSLDPEMNRITYVPGYYTDENGFPSSSTMKLQDGYYYQTFSYVIQTKQNIEKYRDVVEALLHPAGTQMFGELYFIDIIDIFRRSFVVEDASDIPPVELISTPWYSLGANYKFYDQNYDGLDYRVYRDANFKDYDIEMAHGYRGYLLQGYDLVFKEITNTFICSLQYFEIDKNQPIYEITPPKGYEFVEYQGEVSKFTYPLYDYLNDYYIKDDYFARESSGIIYDDYVAFRVCRNENGKGWMTKHNLEDYTLVVEQDYTESDWFDGLYVETGYVSPRIDDPTQNSTYMQKDYVDPYYAD